MMKNADFEKLNFDEGFGYEGEISIDFFGKDVNVDLTVNVEDEKIADIQYETYEKFKEKWNEFQRNVAERIIKYREQNGGFTQIDDIMKVEGIGESKFNKIKENITI